MIATLVNGVGQPAVNVIPLERDRGAARERALGVDVDELVIGITELAMVHRLERDEIGIKSAQFTMDQIETPRIAFFVPNVESKNAQIHNGLAR